MHTDNILHWLDRYTANGFSFFNTGSNDKKVLTKWTEYQTRKPETVEVDAWKRFRTQNYAIVCGEISGIIVIDVDPRNGGDPTPWQNRGFYEVKTPNGHHFYFTYDPLFEKTKHFKYKKDSFLKGVDIQSNGSLVFAPPSAFTKPYTLVCDAPILPIPDDLITRILEALETEPEKEVQVYTPYKPILTPENGRPGDIFNALATWDDVLLPLGWAKVGADSSGRVFWRRPGKRDGISASTNWKGYDLFFPYTNSVSELIPKKGYTRFSLYATLNHDGNFKAAAKALVIQNYRRATGRL